MSWEAIVWARSVHCKAGPVARNVLHQLAIYADVETGDAWPSQDKLAEVTQYSLRSVRDALKALETEGFVVRKRQFRRNGSKTVDRFHLVGWPPTNLADILVADAAEQASWGPEPGPAAPAGPGSAGVETARAAGPGPAAGSKTVEGAAGPESRINNQAPAAGARVGTRVHARGAEPARNSLPEMGPDDPGWPFVLATAREAAIPEEAIRSVFEGFRAHRLRSPWATAEWMPAWRSWCHHSARKPELALRGRMLAKAAAIAAEPLIVNGGGSGFAPGPRRGGRPAHSFAAYANKRKTPEVAESIRQQLRGYYDEGDTLAPIGWDEPASGYSFGGRGSA